MCEAVYDQGSDDCNGTALFKHLSDRFFFLIRDLFQTEHLICILGGNCSITTDFEMYFNVIGLNKKFLKEAVSLCWFVVQLNVWFFPDTHIED